MEAYLSQILKDYVFTLDEEVGQGVGVVGRAVLAVAETFVVFETVCAHRTAPSDKSRFESNVVLQLRHILVKVVNEVKSKHIV